MSELNEPQLRAVRHPGGPLLVFAGAGSGKTRVITHRIANLLSEQRVNPFRILAVTFTNKAAGEMRKRLEHLTGPQVTRDLWVGTFHSICAKLLRRYHAEAGLERQFVIYDDSDQRSLMKRAIRNLGADERHYPHKLMLSRVHFCKREGMHPHELDGQDATAIDIFHAYDRALKTANAVDFEDLILLVMRIAEDPASPGGRELRERFDHVLVDEFQDTNRIQYRLVRALAARTRNLCVVGDDDQSIYSWRGANIENIRGFRRDFSETEVIKLEQNYRSTGNVVRAALAVIAPSRTREPKQLWTDNDKGAPLVLRAVKDERAEGAYVAAQIKREIQAGTAADEIAVFYRINAQSRVIEEALRSERVAYQVIGGMKFFERAEVKDILSYLRLLDNPRSDADLVRIINVPVRGIGNKTIEHLLETAFSRGTSAFDAIDAALHDPSLGAAGRKKLIGFRDLLASLRQSAAQQSPSELAREVLEKTGYQAALEAEDSAESDARLENLQELLGSIKEYEADAEQAGEPANLSGYLERVSLVSEIDGLKDAPQVRLMTVHSAKGLEFQTVILTGMEEEMFPYRGVDGENDDELEEERRLAYVAITRARQRLYITHAQVRTLFGSTRYQVKSRFLDCLPADVVDEQVLDPWSSQGESGRSQRSAPSGGLYFQRFSPAASRGRAAAVSQATHTEVSEGGSHIDYDAFDDLEHDGSAAPRLGSPVFHQRYGRGVVEKVELGDTPKITARFPGFGSRKVLAQYLRFE